MTKPQLPRAQSQDTEWLEFGRGNHNLLTHTVYATVRSRRSRNWNYSLDVFGEGVYGESILKRTLNAILPTLLISPLIVEPAQYLLAI